jgi:hypothetical protein
MARSKKARQERKAIWPFSKKLTEVTIPTKCLCTWSGLPCGGSSETTLRKEKGKWYLAAGERLLESPFTDKTVKDLLAFCKERDAKVTGRVKTSASREELIKTLNENPAVQDFSEKLHEQHEDVLRDWEHKLSAAEKQLRSNPIAAMATIINLAKELAVVVPEMAEDALELEAWVADYLATMLKGKLKGQKTAYTSPLEQQAAQIEKVIGILQDVDFGHRTEKELKKLERASALLTAAGIKPVDIDMSIRYWSTDPERAAAFLYGPSGRGTNKGALRDLQTILHSHKTAGLHRRTAMRYWGDFPYEVLYGHLGLDDPSFEEELFGWADLIPPELEEYKPELGGGLKQFFYDHSGDAAASIEMFMDEVKEAAEAYLKMLFDRWVDDDPSASEERIISLVGDDFAHEEITGAIGGEASYDFMDDPSGSWSDFINMLQSETRVDLSKKINSFKEEMIKRTQAAGLWESVEDEVGELLNSARASLQEEIKDRMEELEEDNY